MKKLQRIYILSFLFSLHIAISAYVNSSYLATLMPAKYVGMLYTIASCLTLFIFFNSSKILKNLGNRRLILAFLLVNMASLAGIIATNNPYIAAICFVLFTTTNTLVFFCIDIFIEHFSEKSKIGKTRGIYITITSLAWMLSPLISGFLIVHEGGYRSIYLLAFCVVAVMSLLMFTSIKRFKDACYKKTPFAETSRFLGKNSHIRAIVIINFMLHFFFAWMVIYTPIYLIEHVGLSWDKLGTIFTIMLAPFVILGLPVGILIDKYHVKKRNLLYIGVCIIAISTGAISFIHTNSVLTWAIILFITRVGASLIESTSEIYFFTHAKEEEANVLSVYRDMQPLSYLIAPLLGTLFLAFFDFQYLFLTLGILLLSILYYIRKLKHNHEEYPLAK